MVDRALRSFMMTGVIETPRGIRIRAASLTLFEESMPSYAPFFLGLESVPVARTARAFSRSAEGLETGKPCRAA
jgi:hypothetical protein